MSMLLLLLCVHPLRSVVSVVVTVLAVATTRIAGRQTGRRVVAIVAAMLLLLLLGLVAALVMVVVVALLLALHAHVGDDHFAAVAQAERVAAEVAAAPVCGGGNARGLKCEFDSFGLATRNSRLQVLARPAQILARSPQMAGRHRIQRLLAAQLVVSVAAVAVAARPAARVGAAAVAVRTLPVRHVQIVPVLAEFTVVAVVADGVN